MVDPTVYLSGGGNFGPVGTPTAPSGYSVPAMITRNLTPDNNGRPEGGHTLSEFKQILCWTYDGSALGVAPAFDSSW